MLSGIARLVIAVVMSDSSHIAVRRPAAMGKSLRV
jgi:hypothetical protein